MEEEIEVEENKKSKFKFKKNILKLNMLVNKMAIDKNYSHIYIAGANTPIMKYKIENGENVKETQMPIHCSGLAIDSNGCLWAHNLNNFKLLKLSSDLEILKEWEGNDKVNLSKGIIFKGF